MAGPFLQGSPSSTYKINTSAQELMSIKAPCFSSCVSPNTSPVNCPGSSSCHPTGSLTPCPSTLRAGTLQDMASRLPPAPASSNVRGHSQQASPTPSTLGRHRLFQPPAPSRWTGWGKQPESSHTQLAKAPVNSLSPKKIKKSQASLRKPRRRDQEGDSSENWILHFA